MFDCTAATKKEDLGFFNVLSSSGTEKAKMYSNRKQLSLALLQPYGAS